MKPNAKDAIPSLQELEHLSREDLLKHFQQAQLGCIPKNASQGFLRGHLAWARQALDAGLDPVKTRQRLYKKSLNLRRRVTPIYKPGTRLIREWHGVTHEVTIEQKGYTWNGQHYRSLSRIAFEITGTKWSGPRFFGLNDKEGND